MKASTSSIVQNKCVTNNGSTYQNGYINTDNPTRLKDNILKDNKHNYYIHSQNHNNSAQTSKSSSVTKSPTPIATNSLDNANGENDSLMLPTPTKETKEYYTALIKPSPAYSTVNKNSWRDSTSSTSNGPSLNETKISTFCAHTHNIKNHPKSSLSQNSREYVCNRYKSAQSIENATPSVDYNKINGDTLAFERKELRRRIAAANNNSSEEDDDCAYDEHNDDEISQPVEHDNADIDAEVSEALFRAFSMPKNVRSNMPTKYHVLSYIANTNSPLYIRRTGTELQITDITGFPLLDVWLKSSCFRPTTWVLEAYGTAVLLFTVNNRKASSGFWRRQRNTCKQQKNTLKLQPSTSSSSHAQQQPQHQQQQHLLSQPTPIFDGSSLVTSTSVLHVQDPEGETLGYIIVGDPFIIQNRDQKSIARIVSSYSYENCSKGPSLSSDEQPNSASASTYSQLLRVYQCILDSNKQEIGRLEVNESHLSLMQLRFGNHSLRANGDVLLNNSKSKIQQSGFTLSLKLLVLASAIRLAAAISSTPSTKKLNQKGQACKSNSTVLTTGTANPSESCCTIV